MEALVLDRVTNLLEDPFELLVRLVELPLVILRNLGLGLTLFLQVVCVLDQRSNAMSLNWLISFLRVFFR